MYRRTPPRHCVALSAPLGSVSLDSQVALLPYESSSLATSRGRKEGRAPEPCHGPGPGLTVQLFSVPRCSP